MLTATAKPSRVSRERKSAQPVRGGTATRTHRKISTVMSQIKIQVILFLNFGQKNHRMLSLTLSAQVTYTCLGERIQLRHR